MKSTSFILPTPQKLIELCKLAGIELAADAAVSDLMIGSAAPIESAGSGDITFLENSRYAAYLEQTKASAVFCHAKYADKVPKGTVALITDRPYEAYGLALSRIYPTAMRPQPLMGQTGVSKSAHIGDGVLLEGDVTIEAGCIIGNNVSIGKGSVVLAGAAVGEGVQVGRNSTVGSNASVTHALIGDNVIIHGGVQIGQDGFGFAMGPGGHKKIAQVGRVIIQDHVEIGANSTIDRGANRDTVIGEGTKIDNMVQIAHNVVIGRHCVIVAQCGIAGSTTLGDFVVVAAQTGIIGHLNIGDGVQIGGGSGVTHNVAAGEKVMGYPAIPASLWMRQAAKQMLEAKKKIQKVGAKQLPVVKSADVIGKKVKPVSSDTLLEIEILELFKLLPHRYPFLMIDKIVKIEADNEAVGIKNVTVNEPHFNGHFPGAPIMPGVLIVEAMAQTAGAICAKCHSEDEQKLVYFMTIDGAKFRKPVVPGDTLELHVKKLKQRRNIFKYDCRAMVNGEKVAEAVISAMMLSKEEAGA